MQPSKDANEVLNTRSAIIHRIPCGQAKSAGEDLLTGNDIGRPVKSVAAVIDSATAFRSLVNSAQELPLTGAHLRACYCGAGRIVEQEADDQVVAFVGEEAAELVEPECSIEAVGLTGN